MQKFLFCLSLLSTTCSYGQIKNSDNFNRSSRRPQLGIVVSPDICYRMLKNNNGSTSSNVFRLRNETEIPKFGYTVGLNLYLPLNSFLDVQTGIQYSNKGYQTKKTELIWEQPVSSSPTTSKSIYNFHYIDIPVILHMEIGKQRLRLVTGIGLTTSILINQTQTTIWGYQNDQEDKKKNSAPAATNKIGLSPTVSAGLDFRIAPKSHVKLEPTFKYSIVTTTDTPISEHLWSGGLNIIYCIQL